MSLPPPTERSPQPAPPARGQPVSELDLQRRWAESRWATPFIDDGDGGRWRVIWPGRWNQGPGPDFREAQLLDRDGRARRGDVELHLRPSGWIAHGHQDDAAYDRVLLHVVEQELKSGQQRDQRVPVASTLPLGPGASEPSPSLPCEDIVARAGAEAVTAALERIARQRFERKQRQLAAIASPQGPGDERDRQALLAVAQALAQPRHPQLMLDVVGRALTQSDDWSEASRRWNLALQSPEVGQAWRRGRGALGTAAGVGTVLSTLLQRWRQQDAPAVAVQTLATLPPTDAAPRLQIPQLLGVGRARQVLADAVYPLHGVWQPWRALPGVRYQRTDDLRQRLSGLSRWRHAQTQALLELERTRCRTGACALCPLARLAPDRSRGPSLRRR